MSVYRTFGPLVSNYDHGLTVDLDLFYSKVKFCNFGFFFIEKGKTVDLETKFCM